MNLATSYTKSIIVFIFAIIITNDLLAQKKTYANTKSRYEIADSLNTNIPTDSSLIEFEVHDNFLDYIPEARIKIKELKIDTHADQYGKYRLRVFKGQYHLIVSDFSGTRQMEIKIKANSQHVIRLWPYIGGKIIVDYAHKQ